MRTERGTASKEREGFLGRLHKRLLHSIEAAGTGHTLRRASETTLPGDHERHSRDLELTRQALAGSTQARLGLARRLQIVPRVVSILNQRMGSPLGREDLEDAAQDVIATIWRRLESYEGRSAFESWAYAFCQRVLSERRRTAQRRPKPVAAAEGYEPSAQDPPVLDFGPLYRALAALEPRSEAELVRLKHFDGLTFDEIGAMLGISPNTAKTRYYRVLRKLRHSLGQLEVEIQP